MAHQRRTRPGTMEIETAPTTDDNVGGQLAVADDVVATVVGLAAKTVKGIHSMGRGSFLSFRRPSPTAGVGVEVGSREVAVDLDVVIEHGCNIREIARELRQKVADAVNKMASREVVEVNINVVDIWLAEDEEKEVKTPRVS